MCARYVEQQHVFNYVRLVNCHSEAHKIIENCLTGNILLKLNINCYIEKVDEVRSLEF